MLTREEIKADADRFFEWDTADHSFVTLTSCLLFAEHCLKLAVKNQIGAKP